MNQSGPNLSSMPIDTAPLIRQSYRTSFAELLRRPSVVLIIMVGLLLSRGITKGEPFYNTDETRHIMNGVFMRDLLVDRPLAHLGFALLGAYFWYRIAERYGPRSRALLAAFVFCKLPTVMIFESVTMLEIPQVALCLGAIFFWLR